MSIRAACGLSWPSDRMIIQVLDDSTIPAIKVQSFPLLLFLFSFFISFRMNKRKKNGRISEYGGAGMQEMGKQRNRYKV